MERNIKEERTKKFFVDAAKEIIKGEGLAALNVRNIAERAAYSPATLYVYFKDLNNLINECIDSFIDELSTFIIANYNNNDKDFYQQYYSLYIKYFIQYTGIFQLLFIETNSIFRKNTDLIDKLILIPKIIKPKYKIEEDQYFYIINGLLLLYLNRNYPISYNEFMSKVQNIFK